MATTRRAFLQNSAAAGLGLTVLSRSGIASADAASIRNHPDAVTIALVGDYGSGLPGQRAVSQMIHSWRPDAVFTMGDNVYSGVEGLDPRQLIEDKVTDYYGKFMAAETFYPSLGNHDWGDPGTAIIELDGNGGTKGAWHETFDYLPGNGRYYDVRIGPVHAFVVHDYFREPDGHLAGSKQYRWLEETASASDAPYKIVVHHYAPYVSSIHAAKKMRWPFDAWGIDTSFTGHWHHYERRNVDGVQYVVNGLGGAPFGFVGPAEPGIASLYTASEGASRLTVSPDGALVEFVAAGGQVHDRFIEPLPKPKPVQPVVPAQPEPVIPAVGGSTVQASEPYLSATGRDATIARLYLAVFERQPDSGGFAYWTGLQAHLHEIANYFAGSPEFVGKYGRLDNGDFVDRVYRNVLGRGPDAGGFAYWRGLLNDGADRADIILGFSESAEFKTRTGITG